jgi:uncharacterized membrane protein
VKPADGRDVARLELVIGRVLRLGTVTSSACFAAGLLLMLIGRGGTLARVLLPAGLFILLATPAARVIASVVEYIKERDWLFVALTLTVLVALAASVVTAFWR